MRSLSMLTVNPVDVYEVCKNEIDDVDLLGRLSDVMSLVTAKFEAYRDRAAVHTLFLFESSSWGDDAQIVEGNVTKREFVNLYSNQMVGSNAGRQYYDRLMLLAPLGKCPFCGFGQVSTLDHFLPKARYPIFSVLTSNLVPSCSDCNKSKGTPLLTGDSQIPHPYFLEGIVETETWLFAEINQSTPMTVRYFVRPPASWPPDLIQRITNYFSDFELGRRFAIEAASELAGLYEQLHELSTIEMRRDHLLLMARSERRVRVNSWRAALFNALSESPWFTDNGYLSLHN